MGCKETKGPNFPTLLCFFETGNEQQANYCLKLRDNFKHEKSINYQIKSGEKMDFKIQFRIKNENHDIQTNFDDSESTMNESLEKMYNLLN